MIESGDEEEIMDGEILSWAKLNLNNFEDDYSNEEEGTTMFNSGTISNNNRGHSRLNLFYLYLDSCYEFNQNINKDTIRDIRKVMRWLKSHNNGGVSSTNQMVEDGGFLGYLETWFQKNCPGNILSFNKV